MKTMPESKKLFTTDDLNAAIAKATAEALANITPQAVAEAQFRRAQNERKQKEKEIFEQRLNAFRDQFESIKTSPSIDTLPQDFKDALALYVNAKIKAAEAEAERGVYERVDLNPKVLTLAMEIKRDELAVRYQSNVKTVNNLLDYIKKESASKQRYFDECAAIEAAANAFLSKKAQ